MLPFALRPTVAATLLVLSSGGLLLAGPPVAFRGARVLTAAGHTYDPGTLVVQDGKIAAVGPSDKVQVPEGATVHDVAGRTIIPGLVDTHSHLGVMSRPLVRGSSDGGEHSGPLQTIVRALDSLNAFDPGIRMATAGGVTTANVMPGSGTVIGGQTIYVKLRGRSPQQMWIASPDVLGGLKMANGENPKRTFGARGAAPGTRMKVAALQRAEFVKAQDYLRKWDRYRQQLAAGEKVQPPEVDLALEPLVDALQRKRTVHFHSHRADDILTTLRLKEEFGFELVLQHGTESYKIVDEIAKHKVPVSMTVVDSPGGKAEVLEFIEGCGAALDKAGVKVIVNTDDPITESRFFLRTAAVTVRGGLPEDAALRAVTLHAAQAMHLDQRLGSLEAGKDADFVILSGPPFSVYSRVLATYIEGQKVFDLADAEQRLYQTGGFAVADRSRVPAARPLVKPQPTAAVPARPAGAALPTSESNELVVLAGRAHTIAKGPIDNAAVHVKDGKIAYVGPQSAFKRPPGVPVLTAATITPGLIDAYSIVPLSGQLNVSADQDADEKTDPNQAELRVLDAFNPGEPLLRFLLTQGITVVHACPGRANVIAGQSGVFRTHGRTATAMTVRFPQAVVFNLGGEPKETYGTRGPTTRMGTAALIRKALSEAAAYARRRDAAENAADKAAAAVERNLKHEALSLALSKKAAALFTAQRADDIQTALRLTREYSLSGAVALASDGYLIADQLKTAGVPVIVHPTMQRVGELETYHSFLGNHAALTDAGIRTAICSGWESYVPKTRVVRHEAAMAAVHGSGFDAALRAVTLGAAGILGIDDRFGSLEPGKVADLVLYDGDPLEHVTHVTHTLVDGRVAYDRGAEPKMPLAQVLYESSSDRACCLGW
jgi:imidazolonepropionase-like amidohydrolase